MDLIYLLCVTGVAVTYTYEEGGKITVQGSIPTGDYMTNWGIVFSTENM